MGLVPAGAYRDRGYTMKQVMADGVPEAVMDVLYDPQSSGGLLVSVPEEQAQEVMRRLEEKKLDTKAAVIGKVVPQEEKNLIVF
jgi:selenide,water dikinase